MSGTNDCNERDCVDVESGGANAWWLAVAGAGDSTAYWVAVSESGDAGGNNGEGWNWFSGTHSLIGLSGTGSAEGDEAAASGTGAATSGTLVASGTGDAQGGFAAISGGGNAGCSQTNCPVIAAAPVGNAEAASAPVSIIGQCNGVQCFSVDPLAQADGYYLAVSGTGNATSQYAAAAIFGNATAPYAISLSQPLCGQVICVHS